MKLRRTPPLMTGTAILACLFGWLYLRASASNTQLDAIREAAFREILPKQGTAYLSIGTTSNDDNPFTRLCRLLHLPITSHVLIASQSSEIDPSDAFLRRFRDYKTVLKKASQTQPKSLAMLIDKQTGQSATIYYVKDIRRLSDTEYEVHAGSYRGYYCDGPQENIYHVVLDKETGLPNRIWIVQYLECKTSATFDAAHKDVGRSVTMIDFAVYKQALRVSM